MSNYIVEKRINSIDYDLEVGDLGWTPVAMRLPRGWYGYKSGSIESARGALCALLNRGGLVPVIGSARGGSCRYYPFGDKMKMMGRYIKCRAKAK